MNNRITYTNGKTNYDLELFHTTYANNNNLAVIALIAETKEHAGTITVNISDMSPTLACIDENNMPGIFEILVEAGIAKYTGYTIESGYCTYPVARFVLDRIPEYKE